jgi:hypothetical protein
LNLFVKSLEGEPSLWFKSFPEKSIKNGMISSSFLKTCNTKTDLSSLIIALYQIKKKENEIHMEFNMRFQWTLSRIPNNTKPTDVVTLNFYLNAFDPQFGLPLNQKEPTDIQDSMEKDATLESYLDWYGEVDSLVSPRVTKAESKAKNQNHVEALVDPLAQITNMMIEIK